MDEQRRLELRNESIGRDRPPSFVFKGRKGNGMENEDSRGDKSTLYLSSLPLPSHFLMAAFRLFEKGRASPPLPSPLIPSDPLLSPHIPFCPLTSPPVVSYPIQSSLTTFSPLTSPAVTQHVQSYFFFFLYLYGT